MTAPCHEWGNPTRALLAAGEICPECDQPIRTGEWAVYRYDHVYVPTAWHESCAAEARARDDARDEMPRETA